MVYRYTVADRCAGTAESAVVYSRKSPSSTYSKTSLHFRVPFRVLWGKISRKHRIGSFNVNIVVAVVVVFTFHRYFYADKHQAYPDPVPMHPIILYKHFFFIIPAFSKTNSPLSSPESSLAHSPGKNTSCRYFAPGVHLYHRPLIWLERGIKYSHIFFSWENQIMLLNYHEN